MVSVAVSLKRIAKVKRRRRSTRACAAEEEVNDPFIRDWLPVPDVSRLTGGVFSGRGPAERRLGWAGDHRSVKRRP